MQKTTYHAFTYRYSSLVRQLRSEIDICANNKQYRDIALWDTGASGTCISMKVVNELSLISTGKETILTPGGSKQVNTYLVDIILPNHVYIKDVKVCDSDIGAQGIGVLIGMDIILHGDFAVSNINNKTAVSFRVPSKSEIDFVPGCNVANKIPTHGPGKRKKR